MNYLHPLHNFHRPHHPNQLEYLRHADSIPFSLAVLQNMHGPEQYTISAADEASEMSDAVVLAVPFEGFQPYALQHSKQY